MHLCVHPCVSVCVCVFVCVFVCVCVFFFVCVCVFFMCVCVCVCMSVCQPARLPICLSEWHNAAVMHCHKYMFSPCNSGETWKGPLPGKSSRLWLPGCWLQHFPWAPWLLVFGAMIYAVWIKLDRSVRISARVTILYETNTVHVCLCVCVGWVGGWVSWKVGICRCIDTLRCSCWVWLNVTAFEITAGSLKEKGEWRRNVCRCFGSDDLSCMSLSWGHRVQLTGLWSRWNYLWVPSFLMNNLFLPQPPHRQIKHIIELHVSFCCVIAFTCTTNVT